MAQHLLLSLTGSLLLTLAAELLFAYLYGLRQELWIIVRMNLLTNPIAVAAHFLISRYTHWNLWLCVLLLEIAVVLTEARYCRGIVPRPLRFALFINLFSYGIGLLIQII